jgi:uncharacterized protein YjdB
VTSVSLNKNATALMVGDTETLVATVLPVNATDKAVIWSSSNGNVATVNDGVVTAVSEGSATITVTSHADNTKQATCAVTVTAVPQIANWYVGHMSNMSKSTFRSKTAAELEAGAVAQSGTSATWTPEAAKDICYLLVRDGIVTPSSATMVSGGLTTP